MYPLCGVCWGCGLGRRWPPRAGWGLVSAGARRAAGRHWRPSGPPPAAPRPARGGPSSSVSARGGGPRPRLLLGLAGVGVGVGWCGAGRGPPVAWVPWAIYQPHIHCYIAQAPQAIWPSIVGPLYLFYLPSTSLLPLFYHFVSGSVGVLETPHGRRPMEALFLAAVRPFLFPLIPDMPLEIWTLYVEIFAKLFAHFQKSCIFAVVKQPIFTCI